jgi:hypothetical protein
MDAAQRSVMMRDTLRQRGNSFVEYSRAGMPPVRELPAPPSDSTRGRRK